METGNERRGAGLSRPGRPETRRAPVSWPLFEPADESPTSAGSTSETRSVAGWRLHSVVVRYWSKRETVSLESLQMTLVTASAQSRGPVKAGRHAPCVNLTTSRIRWIVYIGCYDRQSLTSLPLEIWSGFGERASWEVLSGISLHVLCCCCN